MSLYRKYRPKNFSEVIGQKYIVKALRNSVVNKNFSHAYLFNGPRGTGKTTIARLFAKAINCEKPQKGDPDNECNFCKLINSGETVDIIEIDAASHTGVDNIREIRDGVGFSPHHLKYKAYIIDEVHMLSQGAFNALLKTLEEPPAHAIFILATTEPHKIPATINSRCQRYDFSKVALEDIIQRLGKIAKAEKVKIDSAALELIAQSSEGCVRDSESLLEQTITLEDKDITLEEVKQILGTPDFQSLFELSDHLIQSDASSAIQLVNDLQNQGTDLIQFAHSYLFYLRHLLLLKTDPKFKDLIQAQATTEQIDQLLVQTTKSPTPQILKIMNAFLKVNQDLKLAPLPQLPFELAIIDLCNKEKQEDHTPPTATNHKLSLKKKEEKPKDTSTPEPDKAIYNIKKAPKKISLKIATILDRWDKVLTDLKPHNHSLSAFMRSCTPVELEGNILYVCTKYAFHKERLSDLTNQNLIGNVLDTIFEEKLIIRFILEKEAKEKGYSIPKKKVDPEPKEEVAPKPKPDDPLVSSALEILGGEVVD